jgi:hypothetical protein
MKVLLWFVCCITAFFGYMVYHLRQNNRELQHENFMLKNKVELYQQENTICQESLNRYALGFSTLEKKYPKVAAQFDLFINGIAD